MKFYTLKSYFECFAQHVLCVVCNFIALDLSSISPTFSFCAICSFRLRQPLFGQFYFSASRVCDDWLADAPRPPFLVSASDPERWFCFALPGCAQQTCSSRTEVVTRYLVMASRGTLLHCRPSLLYVCSVRSVCLCAVASLRAFVELTLQLKFCSFK